MLFYGEEGLWRQHRLNRQGVKSNYSGHILHVLETFKRYGFSSTAQQMTLGLVSYTADIVGLTMPTKRRVYRLLQRDRE